MATAAEHVRFEPDEKPSLAITAGSGAQAAIIIVAPIILGIVIIMRIADQPEAYVSWAVFGAMLVSGVTTALQAFRVGRVGAGHVLIMGTSGAFFAVCAAALINGGPGLMATLIVASSLVQFIVGWRLSLMRQLFTPTVTGTVIMLIAATVMPIVFGLMDDVPEGEPLDGAIAAAGTTLLVTAVLILRAPPALRLWSPVFGIAAGTAVAAAFGLYETDSIVDAAWIGVPDGGWPGLDLEFGASFWALLPAFIIVTIVGAIETIGDGVAIQRVSRRRATAPDFRVVQGAVNADGVGNLLSGLMGTAPNTTYSSSIAIVEITGIGARRVGIAIGLCIALVAFFPKIAAVLIAIPGPVAGAYAVVLLGLLFVQGMKIVVNDGIDHRKAAIIGISFWAGVGFTNAQIFADSLGEGFVGILLSNGMTAGATIAVLMTLFLGLTSKRRTRTRLDDGPQAFQQLTRALEDFASGQEWSEDATRRLTLVGEETLTSLVGSTDSATTSSGRQTAVSVRSEGAGAEVEFVSGPAGDNLEDRLAYMGESPEVADENELSYRLLRHYASSVRHNKYHGLDVVTVQVERG